MAIPKTYKTEAIVLKQINLGEADRIVTLYTPNIGKVRAVVKGGRKLTSKLGGHVGTLTHCNLLISRGRNLDTITQSQTMGSFLAIRKDLMLTARAFYLIELLDSFTVEHVENYQAYKLLLDSLQHLDKVTHFSLFSRYFELQLLGWIGYRPQLRECLTCNCSLKPVDNYFSASGGGVLCPECAHTEPVTQPISVNTLKIMRLLQTDNYTAVSQLHVNPTLSGELQRIIHQYIRYLLERELKSTQFLAKLQHENYTVKPASDALA